MRGPPVTLETKVSSRYVTLQCCSDGKVRETFHQSGRPLSFWLKFAVCKKRFCGISAISWTAGEKNEPL